MAKQSRLVWGLILGWLLATAVVACAAQPDLDSTATATQLPPAPALTAVVQPSPTVEIAAYPPPTASPAAYLPPATPEVATAVASPSLTPPTTGQQLLYLPILRNQPPQTAQQQATATAVVSPTPTPIPTLDFAAIKQDLLANGQDLAYAKIGFHVGLGGNTENLEEWMRQLDAAGVPFFLKSVDNAQPILFAQQLKQASGVPHVLVYRKASGGDYNWDVPAYHLPPEAAAELHWQQHRDAFPPELDRSQVWLETINEVDKNQSEWLAQFALKTAELALAEGYNWAAFGWSSGEPEPAHWQGPAMLEFLRLAGQHPDRLAIALHEYSYLLDDIADAYPYKVGRFQELFRIVDSYGIPRPSVLITEWGWTYELTPPPEVAMQHIDWAANLYAPYPEVKGAAIWFLGSGFANIADTAQPLIYPVMVHALQYYYAAPLPPAFAPIEPDRYAP